MTERVVALCRAMGASEDQEELLLPLVQAAETAVAARLKPGARPEDCGAAFPLAVAMEAMEGLEAAEGQGREVTAFTAGDLSVRREPGRGARSLCARAERLLAPWLEDRGFTFRGVRG